MTNKRDLITKFRKMREAKTEFEVLLRMRGISDRKFGMICDIKGSTIVKYLQDPTLLRVKHLKILEQFLALSVSEIVELIYLDIDEEEYERD
tara:strand:- start:1544 stop:1819 length:276 start_codon:yes stop_codon:yes gene_type:complete